MDIEEAEIGKARHHIYPQMHTGGLAGVGPGHGTAGKGVLGRPQGRYGKAGLPPSTLCSLGEAPSFSWPQSSRDNQGFRPWALGGTMGPLKALPPALCLVVRGGPGSDTGFCRVHTLGDQCPTSQQVEELRGTCIFWPEKGRVLSRVPNVGCPGAEQCHLPLYQGFSPGLASPEMAFPRR